MTRGAAAGGAALVVGAVDVLVDVGVGVTAGAAWAVPPAVDAGDPAFPGCAAHPEKTRLTARADSVTAQKGPVRLVPNLSPKLLCLRDEFPARKLTMQDADTTFCQLDKKKSKRNPSCPLRALFPEHQDRAVGMVDGLGGHGTEHHAGEAPVTA